MVAITVAVTVPVAVSASQAGDSLAGRALDAGPVLGELGLDFDELVIVLLADLAMLGLELI